MNGTYVYSDNDEFIEDLDTGKKYYLKTSHIGFNVLHDTNSIYFAETYPALPSYVKRINISSGSKYYIKGLVIKYKIHDCSNALYVMLHA